MTEQPIKDDSTTSRPDWTELLARLCEPFPADVVSWRAGTVARDRKRAQALPYAEPRAYEDRLNAVCPGDWSVAFKPWGDSRLICELTLYGVTRSSTGEYEENARGAVAQGTAAEAQAFKRACSKFGLGRYLYDVPLPWVDYDDEKKRLVETPALPSRFLPANRPAPTSAAPRLEDGRYHRAEDGRYHRAEDGRYHRAEDGRYHRAEDGRYHRAEDGRYHRAEDGRYHRADAPAERAPLLSGERAEAMGKELGKLGLAGREQLELASSVLKRPVSAFTQLSEEEALEVWASAKRQSRSAA